jgi:hypothetical protein
MPTICATVLRQGENPHWLYIVRFNASDLWGPACKAKFDGVGANKKHNWSCGDSRFGGKRRNCGGTSDHSYSTLNEVGRHRRQSILVALRPTVFDRDVLALNVAGLGKAPDESRNLAGPLVDRRSAAEIADNRHRRLLRAHRERPCYRARAEQCDEAAPSQLTKFPRVAAIRKARSIPKGGDEVRSCAVQDFGQPAVRSGSFFHQINPLPTLSACPLRSDRVRTFAPQRFDAVRHY